MTVQARVGGGSRGERRAAVDLGDGDGGDGDGDGGGGGGGGDGGGGEEGGEDGKAASPPATAMFCTPFGTSGVQTLSLNEECRRTSEGGQQ